MRRFLGLAAAIAGYAALGGCFGGGSVGQLLNLAADETRPNGPRSAATGEVITIAEPNVPQALRTRRVPVYVTETNVEYLQGGMWIENPGRLFARLVGEVVGARTGRVVLDPGQYSDDPGTRLSGTLVRFGLDPTRGEVVALYDAAISRGRSGVTVNRFEARVPVAAQDIASVSIALNQAANQIADQVSDWIGQPG